jgi:hypothetical protein
LQIRAWRDKRGRTRQVKVRQGKAR